MSDQIHLRSLLSAPEFKNDVFKLIQGTFPEGHKYARKISIEDEFPLLLEASNSQRVLFLERNKKVLATCAWSPFTFELKNTQLKCAAMGLICTHESERKKGFSSYLLQEAEALAKKENAALSFLWSANAEHYQKLGYLLTGFEYQWRLSKVEAYNKLKAFEKTTESNANFQELCTLYQQEKIGPRRDPDRYNLLLKLPETFIAKTNRSYGFMGKARDLHNCIHELVGHPDDLGAILHRLLVHVEENEFTIQLPLQSKFVPAVVKLFQEGQRGGYAFAKVLNGPTLVDKMTRSAENPSQYKFTITEQYFEISNQDTIIFKSEDFSHFLQLFMGPLFIEEFVDLSETQKNHLKAIRFPHIYFWGFDSV